MEGCLLRTFSSLLDTDGTRLAFGSHAAYTFGDIPQSDETMCFQYTGGFALRENGFTLWEDMDDMLY